MLMYTPFPNLFHVHKRLIRCLTFNFFSFRSLSVHHISHLMTNANTENTNFSDTDDKPIVIPVNAAIRIFYFVTRDDLENCKLVCKTWKRLIDYSDKQLQRRQVDALILSTAREYSISICYGNKRRNFSYRKYFLERDIDEIEVSKSKSLDGPFNESRFRFPCSDRYPRIRDDKLFKPMDNFHHAICKNVSSTIYRHNRPYKKKLFTPPLGYYERLRRMLDRSEVKRLIFHGFTFTDLFVEKIFEYVGGPLSKTQDVIMHCCSFRYITPQALHVLLDGFHAKRYFIEKARFCLPNHISAALLEKSSIQMATTFCVDSALERRTGALLSFPIDDEVLLNFVKSLVRIKSVDRQFFGIAHCGVTQRFIAQYERLAALQTDALYQNENYAFTKTSNEDGSNQNVGNASWLYKHLLFGEMRYRM